MAVDPEMVKVDKGAWHKERAMSVDQWNPTKSLTYDVNSLPQRESRSRRQMTSVYDTVMMTRVVGTGLRRVDRRPRLSTAMVV